MFFNQKVILEKTIDNKMSQVTLGQAIFDCLDQREIKSILFMFILSAKYTMFICQC